MIRTQPANQPDPPNVRPTLVSTMSKIIVVFGGNAGSMMLGLGANIWAMRVLGPESYGVVAVSLVVLFTVWQFTGKGLDQTAVRLAAADDCGGRAEIFGTSLALKLLGALAFVLLGAFTASPLTRFFLSPDTPIAPVFLAFVAAAGASFWGYASAAIQAESRFSRYAPVQVANNAVRLLALIVIFLAFRFSPTSVMIATAIGFFGAAGVGMMLAPSYARKPVWSCAAMTRTLGYGRWLVVSSVLYLLYTRLDILMLSRLVDEATVGLYQAAALAVQTGDLLGASIMTVFLPRFSEHERSAPLGEQVRASLKCSLLVVIPLVPCYWLIEPSIRLAFGSEFVTAAGFLKIMYFGVLFTMVTHPLHILFFARNKPHVLTGLDAFLLVFNLVGHYFAITHYGPAGAAVVVLASRLLAGSLLSIGVYAELRRGEASEA